MGVGGLLGRGGSRKNGDEEHINRQLKFHRLKYGMNWGGEGGTESFDRE